VRVSAQTLRHLERGERRLAEGAERLRPGLAAVVEDDDGGEDLFLSRIRESDDVRLLDGGMAEQHLLHLERRDVDPAGLHHLLDPAAEPEPAVVADRAEIARDQEALGVEGRRVLLRVLVVAGRQITAHEDLADLPRRQRPPRLSVDDADLHAGQGRANGGPSHVGRIVSVRDAAVAVGLGEAVDVADLARAEIHHHLHRWRRADSGAGAE